MQSTHVAICNQHVYIQFTNSINTNIFFKREERRGMERGGKFTAFCYQSLKEFRGLDVAQGCSANLCIWYGWKLFMVVEDNIRYLFSGNFCLTMRLHRKYGRAGNSAPYHQYHQLTCTNGWMCHWYCACHKWLKVWKFSSLSPVRFWFRFILW